MSADEATNLLAVARMLLPDCDAQLARLRAESVASLDTARALLSVRQRDPAWFVARRLRFTGRHAPPAPHLPTLY